MANPNVYPSFYWGLMLLLSLLYTIGLKPVPIDAILIPLFMNAVIAILFTISRIHKAGGDVGFLALLLIVSAFMFFLLMQASGIEPTLPSLAIAFVLTAFGAYAGNKIDRPAFLELLAISVLLLLPPSSGPEWILIAIFLVPLLLFPLILRAVGDYGPILSIHSFSLLSPGFYAIIALVTGICIIATYFSPTMAIPVSIAYISTGHLLHEAAQRLRNG